MAEMQYDLTYNDFNPTVLYASKLRMIHGDRYHCHEDFTELTIVLSGSGRYFVDGETIDVEAGDIIVCNRGVMHRNIVLNPDEPTVEFFTGFLNYHFKNMPQDTIVLKGETHLLRLDSESKQEVKKICYEMLAENEEGKIGKYFMLKAKLIELLLIMLRGIVEPPKMHIAGYNFDSYSKNYAVKKIITYINENYAHKISLDQIAHNMYLSPVYISKIFKEETGEPPINYLIKVRLEKAKEILANGEGDSIKSVANRVGYDDVYHFSKLFKKYYGASPNNFRKAMPV